MSKLNGKVVVITGGNSGIGLGTARAFVREGARVAIMGRDRATLDAALRELGGAAISVQGDVSKLEDLDRLYDAVRRQLGQVDVLFVNAGVGEMRSLDAVDETHFDRLFSINVRGAYFTIQKALPLLNDGAAIVLNTSIANSQGHATMSVYSATKAALRSLARTLSAELVERRIRVNAISPGPIDTPIFDRLGLPAESRNDIAEAFRAQVPMKRFGTTEEIASAVLFLASDESSFILGHELVVDGGMSQL
jgi:NAD(P)-dependent dehydrogenase (short-subunit alcohol dehydrogenase family)